MTELQHTATNPELYERLISRLGFALETANIAVRLRHEKPEELELRGLSRAEFELIEAYLNSGAVAAGGDVKSDAKGSFIVSPESAESQTASSSSARVIWLKDQKRAARSAKPSGKSFTPIFRR